MRSECRLHSHFHICSLLIFWFGRLWPVTFLKLATSCTLSCCLDVHCVCTFLLGLAGMMWPHAIEERNEIRTKLVAKSRNLYASWHHVLNQWDSRFYWVAIKWWILCAPLFPIAKLQVGWFFVVVVVHFGNFWRKWMIMTENVTCKWIERSGWNFVGSECDPHNAACVLGKIDFIVLVRIA